MKHRAEDIADETRGVKDVENRIRVTRGETGGTGGQQSSSGSPRGSREGNNQQSAKSARKSN